ncbi:MAG: UvrD-helicase domain-containing protein [Alphaproteobacteria bacterium]|uniref:DNA 3'-5' helicase n=1 Tax=Candidatus Nitrobium versatile TaxID=2884831 RepID=A0A953M2X9_9BACT|nr:UvrD-helicase domain-containing protein [Candidatus Nitrobium versatile]
MILDDLNPQQREAVEHFGSPLLVLAGAGSGKTKVITHKIAWLVKERGIKVSRILAITFTKKAAREMQERVEQLLAVRPRWISTFHAFCVRILRESIDSLERNFDKRFLIYDEDDSTKLLREILRSQNRHIKDAEAAKGIISKAKQEYRENIIDYIARLPFPFSSYAPVAELYQADLERSNAMDYDDLIYFVVDMLIKKPAVREMWQQRFDYILVDEYQDTNKIQYLLVNLLAGKEGNICVVGDPQQCIYTWRGAHPLNILNFTQDFSAEEKRLEINYRSTKTILDIANKVIARADRMWEGRILELSSVRDEEGEVRYARKEDSVAECSFIARKIKDLVDRGYRYSDIALLMRMSFVSRGIEHTFLNYGIPYEIVGGPAFYDRAEIKDILSYLRLISNRRDKTAFERIINVPPRSIGTQTLLKIRANYQTDWIQALRDTSLTAKAKAHAGKFAQIIESYGDTVEDKPYTVLMELLSDINYSSYLMEHYREDYEDRRGNLSELANVLKAVEAEGRPFSEFMEDSILSHDQDRIGSSDTVKVMTIHAAKGLEFPVVFVVALEEEIFPSARAMESPSALEEERRLFYVAVTRAKERLYLSSAAYRMRFGDAMLSLPSRYVEEIEDDIALSTPER